MHIYKNIAGVISETKPWRIFFFRSPKVKYTMQTYKIRMHSIVAGYIIIHIPALNTHFPAEFLILIVPRIE